MKMPLLFGGAKDPIAILEADAKRRAHRIGRLDVQLAAARSDVAARTTALDEAVAAALDSGDGAEKTAPHRSALTTAQDFVRSISDSLDRERAGLAEVEAHLSEAREAAEREQAAAEIEAECTAFEAAAARLDQPVAALAKAVRALHAEAEAAHAGRGAKPAPITAAILAEALAHRLPELFAFANVSRGFGTMAGSALLRGLIQPDGQVIPHSIVPADQARSATDFARTIVAGKRARAASIRAGTTALPTPPQPMRPREPEFRGDPTMWLVIVAQSIRYRDRQGDETGAVPGQTQLPKLVAEEAIRRGLAHRANTPAANRAAERIALAQRDNGPPMVADAARAIDLGINLADAVAADIAQQRAAWRASQGLKADAA